jgi:hypothetical protein
MNHSALVFDELDLQRPHNFIPPISDAERNAFLTGIPSETTIAERVYLYRYFQGLWDGQGNVIEIGPFLGGTTRAIAWGMSRNPRLSADARLHTFDRFGEYYSPAQKRSLIEPMVRAGVFSIAQADRLCETPGFLNLFEAIHSPHAYHGLVTVHSSPLPDFPEEIDQATTFALFENDTDLGALFVDGCKSWASTHYAMRFLLPRLRINAPVIFQDHGWYTCFWISAFVYALRDVLEWQAYTDSTYAFQLKSAISADEIARRFAKTPREMGESFFKKANAFLYERSQQFKDRRGMLIAQLHHVAALATLNRKPEAARILKKINGRDFPEFAGMIQGCSKSPTYLPGGKQILWNEANNS